MIELDIADFVRDYWQKKPCLIRNAIAGFESPISPEELAGLACEPDVHCRLVSETGDEPPWTLRYGPFEEQDFLSLPESHYTLLVSECEKWIPELEGLMDLFRFIPDWRVDDLMISYAAPGGSVGPHVDQYDVFLLQGLGTRRWQYGESPMTDARLIPGLDLAILQDFDPDQDEVLYPGDMLYLPPGHAHHGVALEPCMTYSIGFRAPTATSVLESLALETDRLGDQDKRYSDPDLSLDRHPAEITEFEIEKFHELTTQLLQSSPRLWRDAVGKMLSDSSVTTPDDASQQPILLSDLQSCSWVRHPETRLFFHRSSDTLAVFFNGQVRELANKPAQIELLKTLCNQREWSIGLIQQAIQEEELQSLLLELATSNAILPLKE